MKTVFHDGSCQSNLSSLLYPCHWFSSFAGPLKPRKTFLFCHFCRVDYLGGGRRRRIRRKISILEGRNRIKKENKKRKKRTSYSPWLGFIDHARYLCWACVGGAPKRTKLAWKSAEKLAAGTGGHRIVRDHQRSSAGINIICSSIIPPSVYIIYIREEQVQQAAKAELVPADVAVTRTLMALDSRLIFAYLLLLDVSHETKKKRDRLFHIQALPIYNRVDIVLAASFSK